MPCAHMHAVAIIRLGLTTLCYTRNQETTPLSISDIVSFDSHLGTHSRRALGCLQRQQTTVVAALWPVVSQRRASRLEARGWGGKAALPWRTVGMRLAPPPGRPQRPARLEGRAQCWPVRGGAGRHGAGRGEAHRAAWRRGRPARRGDICGGRHARTGEVQRTRRVAAASGGREPR